MIRMEKIELYNDSGCDLSNAQENFKANGNFEIKVNLKFNADDVAYVQKCCFEHIGINLPSDYVVEMIARDREIALEAYDRNLNDTRGREFILNYLATETLASRWPIYGDRLEYSDSFFNEFNQIIQKRGWVQE